MTTKNVLEQSTKKKLFIVYYDAYCGNVYYGIFGSKKKANKFMKKMIRESPRWSAESCWKIKEATIDNPFW